MPGWPIPLDYPLDQLVGQEVTQVCIRLAEVQIDFFRQPQSGTPDTWKRGARIDVEVALTIEDDRGCVRVDPQQFMLNEAQRSNGGLMVKLLGKKVTEVVREPRNELRVAFSDGISLLLHTDPLGFESFHLSIGGESITVTGA